MPISTGNFGIPLIASDWIQVRDVTDDSMRREKPPRSVARRRYAGPPANATGRGALGAVVAAALAPEGECAGESGEADREQRLLHAAVARGRRGLCLTLRDHLRGRPVAPAEDGVSAVDDSHGGCCSS